MTVLIYVDTNKQVGDPDHLKVFANADAAEAWFAENDPEGVRVRGSGMKEAANWGDLLLLTVWFRFIFAPARKRWFPLQLLTCTGWIGKRRHRSITLSASNRI